MLISSRWLSVYPTPGHLSLTSTSRGKILSSMPSPTFSGDSPANAMIDILLKHWKILAGPNIRCLQHVLPTNTKTETPKSVSTLHPNLNALHCKLSDTQTSSEKQFWNNLFVDTIWFYVWLSKAVKFMYVLFGGKCILNKNMHLHMAICMDIYMVLLLVPLLMNLCNH